MRQAIRLSFLFVLAFFWAGQASAISLTLAAAANGQVVAVGAQVSVTVTLDTEGSSGIALLSTAVLFDDGILSYNSGASSATSYLLYVAGKYGGPYMSPVADPPDLRYGTTNQVNLDFTATDLLMGTGQSAGYSAAGGGIIPGGLLATLVFDVENVGDGIADFALSITSPGNVIGLAGGNLGTATLNGGPVVVYTAPIPEPTTALLVGLGLLGLGVAGKRRE